ncbi:hypothetical protein T459_25821 [Capsicum annuum]|uniref:Inhibitor I9 domain-containing protein n=1 Tax=Capsicum annuum TaxID=4072 RepID=A0A2G2YLU2_CAPAN|nr:hypothetical protein T459_25821 [Capsicum annuum]
MLFPVRSSKAFGDHFTNKNELETYIVQLEFPDQVFSNSKDLHLWHQSFLPTNSNSSSCILFSYHHVFTGFAATLSSDEVKEMGKKWFCVSATPKGTADAHHT